MKWILIKKVIGFGILFCVFCPLFLSSSSFALSDLSYTLDSSNCSSNIYICSANSSQSPYSCSGYHYLSVISSGDFSSTANNATPYIYYRPTFTSSAELALFNPRLYTSLTLGSFSSPYSFQVGGSLSILCSSFPSDAFITFTLSETDPNESSCPECEECEICPVIPENPYDNKLDNITMAIYVCAGTALVIYFFYCIYRLIIKGVNK